MEVQSYLQVLFMISFLTIKDWLLLIEIMLFDKDIL